MWAALAVSAVVAAAPADAGLQLKNDHFTYGVYGPARKEAEVIPGDTLTLAYDIDGLTVADDGTVKYSTALELLDKDGNSKFKETPPREWQAVNALGGSRLPSWSNVEVGIDTPPGEYTMRISVLDRAAKDAKPVNLERKFTILTPRFGIIQPSSPPQAAVPGQIYLLSFIVIGIETKPGKTAQDSLQSDVTIELSIVDDANKPTLAKPFTGSIKAVVAQDKDHSVAQVPLALNRSGRFSIIVTATDKMGNKTAKLELPLNVIEVK